MCHPFRVGGDGEDGEDGEDGGDGEERRMGKGL